MEVRGQTSSLRQELSLYWRKPPTASNLRLQWALRGYEQGDVIAFKLGGSRELPLGEKCLEVASLRR